MFAILTKLSIIDVWQGPKFNFVLGPNSVSYDGEDQLLFW